MEPVAAHYQGDHYPAACCTGASRGRGCGAHQIGLSAQEFHTVQAVGRGHTLVDRSVDPFDHITVPSVMSGHHRVRVAACGRRAMRRPRSRHQRRPGRVPARHGRRVPNTHRPDAADRRWGSTPVRTGRRVGRFGDSCAALTTSSNSLLSHSSSSQTNAQNSASTAPEPSAAPVSPRPIIASLPLYGHPNHDCRYMPVGVDSVYHRPHVLGKRIEEVHGGKAFSGPVAPAPASDGIGAGLVRSADRRPRGRAHP